MKAPVRFIALIALAAPAAAPVCAQAIPEGGIPIVIPDSRPFGSDVVTPELARRIDLYTDLIVTAVRSIPFFDVLERKQANEIYSEIAYQLNTGGELTDAASDSRLRGARALLLTGFGELYGKVVITARLVDLQSGRVLFASAIFAEPDGMAGAMDELASSIREKGSELGMAVALPDIQRAVKARSWKEAQRLADIYLRDHPSDPTVRSLYAEIAEHRAAELYADARRLVRLKLFKEARIAVDEAIALMPLAAYYAYRDRIAQEEIEHEFSLKADALRREEALRTGTYREASSRAFARFLESVTAEEARLGLSYGPAIILGEDLEAGFSDGDWGFELGWTDAIRPGDGKGILSWAWYAGAGASYESIDGSGRGAMAALWVSPLLAQAVKLGPVVAVAGLDTGAFAQYGSFPGESYRFGFTLGAYLELAVRFADPFGAFVGAKADWRIHADDPSRDGPAIRLTAGMTL